MNKIYTKSGDAGDTGYLGKGRIRKDSPRVRALGALDETNSAIGLVLALQDVPKEIESTLVRMQNDLFEAGASVASEDPTWGAELLEQETKWLEEAIDQMEEALPELDHFILPGGSACGAQLHWARTVCRRAEREVVTAFAEDSARGPLLRFCNRMSDALFVVARTGNQLTDSSESRWSSRAKTSGADDASAGGKETTGDGDRKKGS